MLAGCVTLPPAVDGIDPVCAQILRDAGHAVDERPKISKADLMGVIGDYHGLVVAAGTPQFKTSPLSVQLPQPRVLSRGVAALRAAPCVMTRR